ERRCVRNLSLGSGVCHRPVKYTSWLEELSLELVRGRYGLCQLLSEAREQIGGVRSRDGAGIEIALPQNAAEIEQHLGLLVGFDTLGDDAHAQLAGNIDHGGDHDLGRLVSPQAGDEGAVDLDDVDRKAQQMRERGKAGAEIIERHQDALLPQSLDGARNLIVRAAHEDGLIDLEHNVAERDILAAENVDDALGEVATLEVAGGDIDAHMLEINVGVEPVADIAGHLLKHSASQLIGNTRIGQGRVKLLGGGNAAIGHAQAGQRFDTHNVGGVE